MKRWFFLLLVFGLPGVDARAQAPAPTNTTAVVLFHGKALFEVVNIAKISAEKRVGILTERIKNHAKSPLADTDDFYVFHDDDLKISAIMHKDDIVVGVWEADAARSGAPREKLAEEWLLTIQETIKAYRKDHTTENYIKGAAFAAVATIALLIIWLVTRRIRAREIRAVEKKFAGRRMLKFFDGDSIVSVNRYLMKLGGSLTMLVVFVIYLNLVLSFFPWTFNLSAKLFDLVSQPVLNFGHAFVANLPNLFALLVVVAITMFVLRTLKHLFKQIDEGKVRFRGFYKDWADPTYRLIRVVVVVFAAVIAFPLIPGSSSPAFKGISIFMGVLLSLGSTSAVGNIVAGLVLTYMRPFVTDDFVEISGMRGVVESRGTFSTRLRTPTNEIISIPNASVSSNHIINFSRMAQHGGVNVGTSVTIGYDVPWRKVHELLIAAAEGVEDVLRSPPPKVLQISLADFYVQYKLIVTTKHPERRFPIRSNLHQNIQDNFAAAGIEILSPHYQNNRDGEGTTIPAFAADGE